MSTEHSGGAERLDGGFGDGTEKRPAVPPQHRLDALSVSQPSGADIRAAQAAAEARREEARARIEEALGQGTRDPELRTNVDGLGGSRHARPDDVPPSFQVPERSDSDREYIGRHLASEEESAVRPLPESLPEQPTEQPTRHMKADRAATPPVKPWSNKIFGLFSRGRADAGADEKLHVGADEVSEPAPQQTDDVAYAGEMGDGEAREALPTREAMILAELEPATDEQIRASEEWDFRLMRAKHGSVKDESEVAQLRHDMFPVGRRLRLPDEGQSAYGWEVTGPTSGNEVEIGIRGQDGEITTRRMANLDELMTAQPVFVIGEQFDVHTPRETQRMEVAGTLPDGGVLLRQPGAPHSQYVADGMALDQMRPQPGAEETAGEASAGAGAEIESGDGASEGPPTAQEFYPMRVVTAIDRNGVRYDDWLVSHVYTTPDGVEMVELMRADWNEGANGAMVRLSVTREALEKEQPV